MENIQYSAELQDEERPSRHQFGFFKKNMIILLASAFIVVFLSLLIWTLAIAYSIKSDTRHSSLPPSLPSQYQWIPPDITSKMDFSADPCQDFYQYSCGQFESTFVLPAGVNMYIPTFNIIDEDNYEVLSKMAAEQWPLINDLYESCMMDPAALNNQTQWTLQQVFVPQIMALTDTSDANLLPLLAMLHKSGSDAFWQLDVMENIFQRGSLNYLQFVASGHTYYAPDYANPQAAAILMNAISSVLSLQFNLTANPGAVQNVFNLEQQIAAADVNANTFEEEYQNMTFAYFKALSNVAYSTYLSSLGFSLDDSDTVIVSTASFFAKAQLATIIRTTPVATVRFYLFWRLVYSIRRSHPILVSALLDELSPSKTFQSPYLKNRMPHAMINESLTREFLGNLNDPSVRQAKCVQSVDTLLGDFVGLLFSQQIIDDSVVADIKELTAGIMNGFQSGLNDLGWIDDTSKAAAIYKLKHILQIIGHPNLLDRYRGVLLDPSHYLSNIVDLNNCHLNDLVSQIGTLFDRSANEFPATIVNAFYSPSTNTINFPAGILESPMFSTSFPKILQYARLGYVIGHEITHGFDNNGALWDADGVLGGFLDSQSQLNFIKQAECVVEQYNSYLVLPNIYVNGSQTLGENIADLGGVKNSYRAWKAWVVANGQEFDDHEVVSALNNEQLFFVMLGQTWCTQANDLGRLQQLIGDVHSPSKWRVNGPLSNFDAFADAFKCKSGSNMNPTNQCVIW